MDLELTGLSGLAAGEDHCELAIAGRGKVLAASVRSVSATETDVGRCHVGWAGGMIAG